MLYPLAEYDQNFALKVNSGFWLLMAFLTRAIWVALLEVSTQINLIHHFFVSQSYFYLSLVTAFPALIVLVALARRHSNASLFVRALWRKGGWILRVCAVTGLAVSISSVSSYRVIPELDLLQMIFCFYAVGYVFLSKRLSATFASFPELEEQTTRTKN